MNTGQNSMVRALALLLLLVLALAWCVVFHVAIASASSLTTSTTSTPITLHVPVLMYHQIQCEIPPEAQAKGNGSLFVCPATLDAQMALLESKGWHSILADELARDMKEGVCPGDKTFVVTVDDGALNGYANGAPIWEAHGFRASFAIVTGKVGDYLMDPPPAWYSPDKPHFSWAQAQDLLDRGFGIDNHTVFHTPVANDSPSLLDKEVQAAQNDITNHLGITPSVFVYPYGSYGTGEQSYLAARFDLAFTTRGGALEDPADPMHSPRLRVSRSTTPGDLLKRMSSFAHPCVTP